MLDDYYLNYLLGVLMEQDDVLLVVFEKNGEVEVRHTISKQTYDDVGLVALQDQYEDKLSIQLNLDVACKFLGDGRPKEVCRFAPCPDRPSPSRAQTDDSALLLCSSCPSSSRSATSRGKS